MRARSLVRLGAFVLAVAAPQALRAQTWSDEFNGTAVNTADWNFEVGGGGWGNNELEYYQPQNATVSGGALHIQARRESVGGMPYTSTRMNTANKHAFTYGNIQARIQGQNGQGYWPAFWMLGSNIGSVGWPGCGEIDIIEHINSVNVAYGTIHWDNGSHVSYTGSAPAVDFTQWHTYGIAWDTNGITWQVDGANTGAANIQNNINGTEEFHKPFFIILNFAVGGSWPGNPDGSTVFPANFNVDYVRVSPFGSPAPTPTPSSGGTGTIVNKNSGKCVDAAAAGTANGTVVQQYTCNGTGAQKWVMTATSGGYYRLGTSNNSNQVWDVTNVSAADGAKIQLWAYGGGNNQQWLPVSEGSGYYHFVSRYSGKCLDVPAASTADAVQLQQYTCNGTGAQSFKVN